MFVYYEPIQINASFYFLRNQKIYLSTPQALFHLPCRKPEYPDNLLTPDQPTAPTTP
jgi:hypothetical protein